METTWKDLAEWALLLLQAAVIWEGRAAAPRRRTQRKAVAR